MKNAHFLKKTYLSVMLLFAVNAGFAQRAIVHIYANPSPSNDTIEFRHFELEYKKSTDGDLAWIPILVLPANFEDLWDEYYTPYMLSGLDSETEYMLRARVYTDSGDYGVWGSVVTFTTPEELEGGWVWGVGPFEVRCGNPPVKRSYSSEIVPESGKILLPKKQKAIKEKKNKVVNPGRLPSRGLPLI